MNFPDPLLEARQILGLAPAAGRTIADMEGGLGGQLAQFEFTPEEQESLVSSLARNTLGPIATVANVLDAPGGAVRDLLAGKNPLPGIFNPEHRTTGRELLTNYFGVSENDPDAWELADLGGFMAEVVTDPLAFATLPLGATSKAGRAAEAAGLMRNFKKVAKAKKMTTTGEKWGLPSRRAAQMKLTPQDLIGGDPDLMANFLRAGGDKEMLSQPLGGLIGFGLPFGQPMATAFSGPTAQNIAGGLDVFGEAIRYGKYSPVRQGAKLFSSANIGTSTKGVQPVAQDIFDAQNVSRTKADAVVADLTSKLQRLGINVIDPEDIDKMRRVVEGLPAITGVPTDPALLKIIGDSRDVLVDVLAQMKSRGIDISGLNDIIDFWPRYMSKLPWDKTGAKRHLPLGVMREIDQGRQDYLKGIAGGTEVLRRLFKQSADDPRFVAAYEAGDFNALELLIEQEFGSDILPTYSVPRKNKKGRVVGRKTKKDRYHQLAKTIMGAPPETRAVGLFGNHPIIDLQRKLRTSYDQIAAADGVLDGLVDLIGQGTVGPSVPGTTVGDLLKLIGISTSKKTPEGMDRMLKALGKSVGPGGVYTPDQYLELKNLRIPKDIADDLVHISRSASSDLTTQPILNAWDSFTAIFKAGVLTRPARYFRDFASGQYENMLSGQFSSSSLSSALKILRGENSSHVQNIPIVKKMLSDQGRANTPENATDIIRQLAAAHGVAGKMTQELSGAVGAVKIAPDWRNDVLGMAPGGMGGTQPFRAGRVIKKGLGLTKETSWNPLDIRGVGLKRPRIDTRFGPVAAGEDIGAASETLNRLSPFIRNLEKGMDPFQASIKVNAAQVLYSNRALTDFERDVLLRAFPFYRFMRGKIPHHMKMLWEQPGGRLGQTLRGLNVARREGTGEQDIIPQYISETAAIPLESGPSGQPRFMTGAGLMLEDPVSFAGALPIPGVFDPKGAGIELLSRLNPVPKFAIESIFDETLFQRGPRGGRELEDLDPLLGRTISNIRDTIIGADPTMASDPVRLGKTLEHAVANSPISAWLTMARKASDPRKGTLNKALNLLTGLRTTDISAAAQESLLRELATSKLQQSGGKIFEKAYYPKEKLAELTPQEFEEVMQAQALLAELAKRAKLRKIQ